MYQFALNLYYYQDHEILLTSSVKMVLTKKEASLFRGTLEKLSADAKVQDRIKAVKNIFNGNTNLKELETNQIDDLWESLFFSIWYAELGRGFEEITAAITSGCNKYPRLLEICFKKLSQKWYGLDQHRVDKVSHLARHLLSTLINYQIEIWLKALKYSKKKKETIKCRQVLWRVMIDVHSSKSLCDFILENFNEETSKCLNQFYYRRNMVAGYDTVKSKLLIFVYNQLIRFASSVNLEPRFVHLFEKYVFKLFFTQVLSNESQVSQIYVTLRLNQALKKHKSNRLLTRWSSRVDEIHQRCINGEYFPHIRTPHKLEI